MKINILEDKIMKDAGFNSVSDNSRWYLCKNLELEISFNFTIIKETGVFKIDILDEDFLQPYDFQYILKNTPTHKVANEINKKVIAIILELVNIGIVEDYTIGDYI